MAQISECHAAFADMRVGHRGVLEEIGLGKRDAAAEPLLAVIDACEDVGASQQL
jgi:hypothetical protein